MLVFRTKFAYFISILFGNEEIRYTKKIGNLNLILYFSFKIQIPITDLFELLPDMEIISWRGEGVYSYSHVSEHLNHLSKVYKYYFPLSNRNLPHTLVHW